MSIGFQVLERARKVDAQWVGRYREVPVANVSDGGPVCVRCIVQVYLPVRP